jgi:hypothetical protein
MKKLVFGLIATIFMSIASFGQTNDPSNPKNEYDYVGKTHNVALIKLLESDKEKELFSKNPTEYSIKILESGNIPSNGFISIIGDENVINKLGAFEINKTSFSLNEIATWYDEKYISKDVKMYLENLLEIVEGFEKNNDYSILKNRIIELEDNSNELNENDRVFVLSVSSLTRYSFSFWIANSNSLSARGSIRNAAVADLAGAVGGGVRTAVVCAFTGPVGWGAWCGAVIGSGLGASAAYGIVCWLGN